MLQMGKKTDLCIYNNIYIIFTLHYIDRVNTKYKPQHGNGHETIVIMCDVENSSKSQFLLFSGFRISYNNPLPSLLKRNCGI